MKLCNQFPIFAELKHEVKPLKLNSKYCKVPGIFSMTCLLMIVFFSHSYHAQIFYEDFNDPPATIPFDLNTSDLGGNSVVNSWVINNQYVGGSGTLTNCLNLAFTIPDSPPQPLGITDSPSSSYLHIVSNDAVLNGISNSSFAPSDGGFICYNDESNFAAMNTDVSTVGYNNVEISFWWACQGSSTSFGEVYYSTDGGNTWNIVNTIPLSNTPVWTQLNYANAQFDGNATLRFGFRFVNTFDAFGTTPAEPAFQIDDFYILGSQVPCPPANIINLSPVACNSYTAPDGTTYNSSGIYQDTIINTQGCDSVITVIDLIIDSTGTDGNSLPPIITAEILSDSMCATANQGIIDIAAFGGLGNVSLLINNNDSILGNEIVNPMNIPGLSCGSLLISAIGEDGCRADTTLVMPCYDPIGVFSTVISDETCDQSFSGSIEITCSGPNQPVNISFNGQPAACGDLFDGLTCSTNIVNAIASNGCEVNIARQISCPLNSFILSETITNSNIDSVCSNQISPLIVNCPQGTLLSEIIVNGTVYTDCQIGVFPLICGDNVISLTDSSGCTRDTIIHIACYTPIQISVTALDVESCYLAQDARIEVACTGAILPSSITFQNESIPCNSIIDSLSCGTYVAATTDLFGCIYSDSVTIDCPPLNYDFTQTLDFNGAPLCVESNNGDTIIFNPGAPTITQILIDNSIVNIPVILPVGCGDHVIQVNEVGGCSRDTVISIPCIEELTIDLVEQYGVYCLGNNSGQIQVVCDAAFDSITVNNGLVNCGANLSNLVCGEYIARGYYSQGCMNTDTLSIQCPSPIQFVLDSTNVLCHGNGDGQIEGFITGGNGRFYSEWWLDGSQLLTSSGIDTLDVNLTGLSGGTYGIFLLDTVITSSGLDSTCLFNDTISVLEPELFEYSKILSNATCYGYCDGNAEYTISGGTPPYGIAFSDTDGVAASPIALCPETYYVLIVDENNCSLTDTIEISQPDSFVFQSGYQSVTCFGICDGVIDITQVSGANGQYTYSIFPAQGNCGTCDGDFTQFTGLCANNYTVTITDSAGCSVDSEITISSPEQLILIIDKTNVTCFGLDNGQIALDFTGGTGAVSVQSLNLILPDTISDLAPQMYHFTITDSAGCTAIDSALITEPAVLEILPQAVNAVSCGTLCDGSIVYIPQGGTPPYSYLLAPDSIQGSTNGLISDLCAGDYELFISDLQDCSDSIDFTIESPDILEVTSIIDQPTCTGMLDGSIQILPTGGVPPIELGILNYEYDLFPVDSVSYAINNLGEDSLFFILTDAVNCSIVDTVVIVPEIISDMILNIFSSPETCWGEINGTATIAVTNGHLPISYQWDDPNLQTTPSAVGLASNQEYTVTVTDQIGCTLKESVFVENTDSCFVITNALTPNGDGINDTWVLGGLEFFTDTEIFVHNRWGQQVFFSKGYSQPWDGTFQGQPLPIGDYYFSINFKGNMERITGTVTIKY